MLTEAHRDANELLADCAVESSLMSAEQSEEALAAWLAKGRAGDFGMFLVSNHYLSADKLWELVQARNQRLKQRDKTAENGAGANGASGASPAQHSVARPIRERGEDDGPRRIAEKDDLLQYGPEVKLHDLLCQAMAFEASDLHVHSGAPLSLRLGGEIRRATAPSLSAEECERLLLEVLDAAQRRKLEEQRQVDFSFEIPEIGRFRANAYRQQRGIDAVFRMIELNPPTLKELGMPSELGRFAEFHQGLMLFTGPAGCGKSSTMAALIRQINEQRPDHVLTIEDPVEYVHVSQRCNVNQREVGAQTESFPRALRAALREDPDIIVIGELRDLETVSLAITAAETGHLVLGTLHTSNAVRTINRLLAVFPPQQQEQIRVMLSESLKAVVSQRLVRRADGRGVVPAVEVLINNGAIGNLIRENRTHQIKSILQTGGAQGQRLLDASLLALYKDKLITREEAQRHAEEPDLFR